MQDSRTAYIANGEGERTHIILPIEAYQKLLDTMEELKDTADRRRRELIRLERRIDRLETGFNQLS